MKKVNEENINIAVSQLKKRRAYVDENGDIIDAPVEEMIMQYHYPTVGLTDEEMDIAMDRYGEYLLERDSTKSINPLNI